jgi:hypothetical protein
MRATDVHKSSQTGHNNTGLACWLAVYTSKARQPLRASSNTHILPPCRPPACMMLRALRTCFHNLWVAQQVEIA